MSQPIAMPQSDFARDLTNDVLRQIYRSALLTKLHAEKPDAPRVRDHYEFSPEDRSPEAEEAGYVGVPVAPGLTAEEQQNLIAQGDDPWARDVVGNAHKRLEQAPFDSMFSAARALFAIKDPSMLEEMGQPGAITSFILPDEETRYGFERDLAALITALAVTQNEPNWEFTRRTTIGPLVLAKPGSHRRRPADTSEFEKFVRAGETVFAVMEKPEDLPLFARPLSCQIFNLPPFNRMIALALLRQTHSVTGLIADHELLRRLPTDAELNGLSIATIAAAFHAETTLKVADRLAEFCSKTEQPAPPPKSSLTLDAMALSPDLETQAEQILTDLKLWTDEELEWTDVPSSLFLHGEPGNGKTLFAQALAGSAAIPLIATSYAECQKMGHLGDYFNEMAGKVEKAIKQAPCVFFIDEMDNFFTRTAGDRNARYMHSVVNGLLEQLTKLNETPGVILIGAGNNRSGIDPAVLRSGRFDHHIEVKRPDHKGIQKLLRHLAGDVIHDDLAIEIADQMLGKSAADVTNLLRRAKSQARRAGEAFGPPHLTSELGALAPVRSDDILHRISIHEAGHVVVGFHLGKPLPERVQITTQGGEYHGMHEPCYTIDAYKKQLTVLLAGRAAEDAILGAPSDGASDDLQHATALAFQAHGQWGLFDDELIALHGDRLRFLDPNTGVGKKINQDMNMAFEDAKFIVVQNRERLLAIADRLARTRELDHEALSNFLIQDEGNRSVAPDSPEPKYGVHIGD